MAVASPYAVFRAVDLGWPLAMPAIREPLPAPAARVLTSTSPSASSNTGLIPVKADTRVPMRQVQQLFAGKLTPSDVLQAAEEGPEGNRPGQRFYAYLYIGLYHEATGQADLAEAAIQQAAALASTGGYMGDVARVHAAVYTVKAEARAAEKPAAPAPPSAGKVSPDAPATAGRDRRRY